MNFNINFENIFNELTATGLSNIVDVNFESVSKEEFINYQIAKIQEQLTILDNFIFNSDWRKHNGFIANGFVKRQPIMEFGIVSFKRRKYKIWNQEKHKWEYGCLADQFIKWLKKHQRVTEHVKKRIKAHQNSKYSDIIGSFWNLQLSKTIVSRIRCEKTSIENKIIVPKVEVANNLYILSDHTHQNVWDEHHQLIELRTLAVIFATGKKKVGKNRYKLIDKRGFHITTKIGENIGSEEMNLQVIDSIKEFFTVKRENNFFTLSDGELVLKNITDIASNCRFILDKFHPQRYFKLAFGKFDKRYWKCVKFLNNGQWNELVLFLWAEYEKTGKKEVKDAWRYIKNNQEGVINQALPENIGCCIEGQIAHLKSGTRGKILSQQNYLNSLNVKFAKMNGYIS